MGTEDRKGSTCILDIGEVEAWKEIDMGMEGDAASNKVFDNLVNAHNKKGEQEIQKNHRPFKRKAADLMVGRISGRRPVVAV